MKLALVLAVIASSVGYSAAFAANHIPQLVNAMSDAGKLQEATLLPVMFALKLNNEDELNARIAEIYRFGSSTYHQFLSSDEFKSKYAPTEAQIERERAFLESSGISVASISENQMFIRAFASVATLNQVFKTELHNFSHPNGKTYFAPAQDVQIPEDSRITSIIGLNNTARLRPHVAKRAENTAAAKPEGSAPGGGLAPADIAKAYDVPSSANGAGQTIALFELDGYDPSDIQAYEQQFGLTQVPLKNIYVDGATGSIGDPDAQGEVTLDIEMVAALAPKATRILVYEGPTADESALSGFEQGYLDVMQKIADDNLANQISTSWGNPESNFGASDVQAESEVFKQMASQGQTLFAASGDSGAEDDSTSLSVDNPASQPYVVGVGGTTLKISSTGAFVSETVWNDLSSQHGAGGGGVSKVWSIPAWQQGVSNKSSQMSSTMRNVPDVSLNADPETGYGIYLQGKWQVIGGTSAAAPLWAAMNALINQERTAKNLSITGFLAETIYADGNSSAYSSSFNDITSGTNGTGTKSFKASVGYDDATGFGSFKALGLLQALAN